MMVAMQSFSHPIRFDGSANSVPLDANGQCSSQGLGGRITHLLKHSAMYQSIAEP